MRATMRRCGLPAILVTTAVLTACGSDGTSPPLTVASVQMSTTYSNPRVGETSNITAKPVTAGGIQVPNVACSFASGSTGIATVNATSGVVTAVSPGTAAITATCGGVSNSLTITVRPRQFTLTVTKTGAGVGAVFNSPAGSTFDEGTVVSVTATASAGSSFTGWTGACVGKTQPCSVTMNANKQVTADFADGEQFTLSVPFGGSMSSVSDPAPPGCNYTVSIQVTAFDLLVRSTTAAGTAGSSISVTPTGGSCTGNPFTVTATGTLTVTGNNIAGTLVFFSATRNKNTQTLTINATRTTSSITGTLSINQKLYNGAGTEFTSTGGPYNFTLNKQ